jgi:hypothetical protein
MHDRQPLISPQRMQEGQARMQSKSLRQGQDTGRPTRGLQRKGTAQSGIIRISVGSNGGQPVHGAAKDHKHEFAIFRHLSNSTSRGGTKKQQ